MHIAMCLLFAGQLTALAYGSVVLSFTFVWNIGLPYLLGLIADSDATGRLVVLIISSQALGNTIGPLVAGGVAERGGLDAVGLSSAGFCLVALALLSLFILRCRAMFTAPAVAANS